MKRKAILLIVTMVIVAVLLTGCITTATAAIQRIDEEDVTIAGTLPLLPTSEGGRGRVEILNISVDEATRACERYGRTPELLSYRILPIGSYEWHRNYTALYACNP